MAGKAEGETDKKTGKEKKIKSSIKSKRIKEK